jgi:tRNA-2-methylthio-N6-dimethylallyladenosine synthase
MSKKLYIETLGCAMNVRDSEHIVAELSNKKNYHTTQNLQEADLIIINTCSVREKPVSKLFSEIGVFNKLKKNDAKIGVCGCTASHLGEEIIKKAPAVDFVLGARNVSKISTIIDKPKAVEISIDYDESSYIFGDFRGSPHKAYINISIGCDKQCTFCIVPKTRGQEISIPISLIVSEAKRAVDNGAKEIILLGQNVNNYGKSLSNKDKKITFTTLLQEISKIDGLHRIRFTSPHPLHMDDEFINEFATNDKICKSIHMPLQSGSDKILKDMKRGYSKEWFINRAKKIRQLVDDVTISTDIIVGFPGETYDDFLETLEVIDEIKFEQIFSFKYSPRPLTQALELENIVSNDESGKRLQLIIQKHKQELDKISIKQIGKIFNVLFEEFKDDGYLVGKSDNNFTIKAKGTQEILGEIKKVKIISASRMHLEGQIYD